VTTSEIAVGKLLPDTVQRVIAMARVWLR